MALLTAAGDSSTNVRYLLIVNLTLTMKIIQSARLFGIMTHRYDVHMTIQSIHKVMKDPTGSQDVAALILKLSQVTQISFVLLIIQLSSKS